MKRLLHISTPLCPTQGWKYAPVTRPISLLESNAICLSAVGVDIYSLAANFTIMLYDPSTRNLLFGLTLLDHIRGLAAEPTLTIF